MPAGLGAMAAAGSRLTTGHRVASSPPPLGIIAGMLLLNLVSGPLGEEAGWRGLALPRLPQRTKHPLKAAITLGILWDLRHLPLWATSGNQSTDPAVYCLSFSVCLLSLSVLMTWIFLHSAHSLTPMVLTHFSFNTTMGLIGPGGSGLGEALPDWEWMALLTLLSAVVVYASGGLKLPERSGA